MTTATRTPTSVPAGAPATATGPVGRIIAACTATGAVGAAALTFAVLPDASEARIVGAALVAFATGWAILAWLTTRMTTRPQRWAYVPATLMATSGAVMLAVNPGEPAMTRLAWAWAPALVVLAVWVQRRTRRTVPGRSRLLIYPVTLAMLAAGTGGLYQATTKAPDVTAGTMPGRLVDVGGYRLHISCTGIGAPTVVLLNGLGETSPLWARINPPIAATTRVCTYDRAGQGWSDDSPNPADATNAATDLHRLLTAADESGPFVLAGHSSGGVHALTYTHLYPHDVVGVVLLDSASPHQVDLVKPFKGEHQLMRRVLAVAPTLFRFGIGHVIQAMTTPALPGAAGKQVSVFANSTRGMANMRAEQAALPDAFRQAQALTTLGVTPLVVLTARDNVDHKRGWGDAQDRLAALSTNTRHTVADLDHVAFLADPAGAALSITAIADVVTAVRTHTPVPTP
ncbi:alpha/beta hydrolase [Dactylosporangium sp. NPDC005555]|uniref:alpha/beta fold hydrolase n=1 Tax=Dactylosporangium sp. NPDC005555 TaxID=3154889 RepID=UPI00339F54F7